MVNAFPPFWQGAGKGVGGGGGGAARQVGVSAGAAENSLSLPRLPIKSAGDCQAR